MLLSRMDRHEQVIAIYVRFLGNLPKALAYCDNVYKNSTSRPGSPEHGHGNGVNVKEQSHIDGQGLYNLQCPIYVTLLKVLLDPMCGMDFLSSNLTSGRQGDEEGWWVEVDV